jgi:hypothetical protein
MPVTFVCRACGAALEVDDELAGRPVACGHCQAEQRAPGSAPVTVPVVRPIAPRFPDPADESGDVIGRRRGLSPIGKVAFITAAMVALLAAGGVALTLTNPGGWHRLQPPGGGFTVDMPGRINPTPQTTTITAGLNPLKATSYTSERAAFGRVGMSAEVRYADLGVAPDPAAVPVILTVFANIIRQEAGHVEIKRQSATLDGAPGLMVLVEVEKKNRVVYQLAVKDKRLFILALAGDSRLAIDGPAAKRFFGSFHFTAD